MRRLWRGCIGGCRFRLVGEVGDDDGYVNFDLLDSLLFALWADCY